MIMKHRLIPFIVGIAVALLAVNVSAPARAKETNETKQAKSDKSVAAVKMERRSKVKALALGGVPEAKWKALVMDVDVARELGRNMAERLGGEQYDGDINIQSESKILIASGSEGFIEMVESVV